LVSSAVGLHAAVLEFSLQGQGGSGMLPSNEVPPVSSSASGIPNGNIQYNTSNNQLTFDIPFSNLSSAALTAAIRGPADMTTGGAPVLYDLTTGYLSGVGATSGSITSPGIGGTLTLTANPNGSGLSIAQQESDMNNGLWYIELTSQNFQFGEIRGNLTPIPEPSQYAALTGLALAGYAAIRRKFRR
jgi:hypothetical protein